MTITLCRHGGCQCYQIVRENVAQRLFDLKKKTLFIDRFSNAYIYCHVISGIAVLYGSGSRSTRAL